jgi:putative membrane protein
VLTLTVLALARLLPGVHIRSVGAAIVVAIVFSLLDFFLGWVVRVFLFIPAILTLGLLFLIMPFVVNTILLWLTDKMLRAFEIDSFGSLLVSSLVITLVNGAFQIALHPHVYRTFTHPGAPPRWI